MEDYNILVEIEQDAFDIDAFDILAHATQEALNEMISHWTVENELGFVMIRRAMRHSTLRAYRQNPQTYEEMY